LKRLRHRIEWLAARAGLYLIDSLSFEGGARLADTLGGLGFWILPNRRRTAIDNVRRAGLADTPRDARRIALESFRHFARVVVESLQFSRLFEDDSWRAHVTLNLDEGARTALEEPGTGLILASGHLGNWEIAAQVLSTLKPVVGITRDMNNPHTDAMMKARKPRNRFRLEPKHTMSLTRFISVLKNGEALAMLFDQHARDRGMIIPFLGRPASTHTSIALLHLITRAPICFGSCIRTGPMQFTVTASQPIRHLPTGDKAADIQCILERLNHHLEKAVHAHPGQYLWAHRRWRVPENH
jgi:KDO2-lipid IV(A) lauroyltransferase